jgi:hypothetical protein
VSYMTTEMTADRVYLHFDVLDKVLYDGVNLKPDGQQGVYANRLTSQSKNVFLEIKTNDFSTWNVKRDLWLDRQDEAVAKAVEFTDWVWPYDIEGGASCAGRVQHATPWFRDIIILGWFSLTY